MSDMPGRIWAEPEPKRSFVFPHWFRHSHTRQKRTEYIRADLVDALVEAAKALAREARCVQQDGQDASEYNEELDVCATMTEAALSALEEAK
jgi:hypothetical protein